MGGGFPIKAFGNDKLVLTEVRNGQCITSLPNVYDLFIYKNNVNTYLLCIYGKIKLIIQYK